MIYSRTNLYTVRQQIGEGDGTPVQYSCLENPMDGGAWWAAVHGVTKSWTHFTHWATSLSLFISCIGEGNGNPLQCSCLENPRDGGAWWAAVYGVAQSRTQLKWLSSSSRQQIIKKAFLTHCFLEIENSPEESKYHFYDEVCKLRVIFSGT